MRVKSWLALAPYNDVASARANRKAPGQSGEERPRRDVDEISALNRGVQATAIAAERSPPPHARRTRGLARTSFP